MLMRSRVDSMRAFCSMDDGCDQLEFMKDGIKAVELGPLAVFHQKLQPRRGTLTATPTSASVSRKRAAANRKARSAGAKKPRTETPTAPAVAEGVSGSAATNGAAAPANGVTDAAQSDSSAVGAAPAESAAPGVGQTASQAAGAGPVVAGIPPGSAGLGTGPTGPVDGSDLS